MGRQSDNQRPYNGKHCQAKLATSEGRKNRLSTGDAKAESVAVKTLAAVPPGQLWWSGMPWFKRWETRHS